MGSILTRLSPPASSTAHQATDWDEIHDFGTRPPNPPLSTSTFLSLLVTPNTQNQLQQFPDFNTRPASTIHAPISRPLPVTDGIIEATENGMMAENLLFAGDWPLRNDMPANVGRGESGFGSEKGSWDGNRDEGCRHVRWKGRDM